MIQKLEFTLEKKIQMAQESIQLLSMNSQRGISTQDFLKMILMQNLSGILLI